MKRAALALLVIAVSLVTVVGVGSAQIHGGGTIEAFSVRGPSPR